MRVRQDATKRTFFQIRRLVKNGIINCRHTVLLRRNCTIRTTTDFLTIRFSKTTCSATHGNTQVQKDCAVNTDFHTDNSTPRAVKLAITAEQFLRTTLGFLTRKQNILNSLRKPDIYSMSMGIKVLVAR